MLETIVVVKNRAGLHTRPAAILVKLASEFKSEITLIRDGFTINAKSIIGVMTLAAEQGCELTIQTDGEDEESALDSLKKFFDTGFDEL